MKKILSITFVMFFLHFFILVGFFARLSIHMPKYYQGNDHGLYLTFAFFITIIIYILSIILVFIEYIRKFNYRGLMTFLLYVNCLLQFYMNSYYQFRLFKNPEWYGLSSIIIIITYLIFELIFTFYIIKIMYKSESKK